MIYNNIVLEVRVSEDWKKALEEAQDLSKHLGIRVRVNFMNQKI